MMRNLTLQTVVCQPDSFPAFETNPGSINRNYLVTSRDGRFIVALTFLPISDVIGKQEPKCVHLSVSTLKTKCVEVKNIQDNCKSISLLDIIQDAEEEELEAIHNSPAVGIIHGAHDDEYDDLGETLDIDCVHTFVIGIESGQLIKIRLTFPEVQLNEHGINATASIIGSFDDGLARLSRSPDDELVVAVSNGVQGNGQQVIIMSA